MRSFIVAVSLILFAATCSAQRIYAINGTTLRTDEHAWGLRTASGYYGLLQFSDRHSAEESFVRRTSICLGVHEFTVQLPAVAVAAVALLAVGSVVLLVVTVAGRVRRVHRHANAL
jgi:hypothetical protein